MPDLPAATEEYPRNIDLVFEGGGLKGIALFGAYSVLEEQGYRSHHLAGASAGAVVAALVAAGYTAAELREIVGGFDFSNLKDRAWEDLLPALSKTVSILKDRGVYEGEALLEWMSGLLEARAYGPSAISLGAPKRGLSTVTSCR